MKFKLFALAIAFACLGDARATVVEPGADSSAPATEQAVQNGDFCFLRGMPPSDVRYTRIKDMKLGKASYGGIKDIIEEFAGDAHAAGADAIINYTGAQRFGFWPWRVVRPVVKGLAVKWQADTKPDCKTLGGATLQEILATNKVPTQQ